MSVSEQMKDHDLSLDVEQDEQQPSNSQPSPSLSLWGHLSQIAKGTTLLIVSISGFWAFNRWLTQSQNELAPEDSTSHAVSAIEGDHNLVTPGAKQLSALSLAKESQLPNILAENMKQVHVNSLTVNEPLDIRYRDTHAINNTVSPPVLINNNLQIWLNNINEGVVTGYNTITTANLLASSPNTQDDTKIVFTVSNVQYGYFAYWSIWDGKAITSFNQADVKSNTVVFVTDASGKTPSYEISVSDGQASTAWASGSVTNLSLAVGLGIGIGLPASIVLAIAAACAGICGGLFCYKNKDKWQQKWHEHRIKQQEELELHDENRKEDAVQLSMQAKVHFENELYDKAKKACEKAIALDPTVIEPYVYLALCYEKQGQLQKAADTLGKVVEIDANHTAINEHLPRIVQQMKTNQVPLLLAQAAIRGAIDGLRETSYTPALPGIYSDGSLDKKVESALLSLIETCIKQQQILTEQFSHADEARLVYNLSSTLQNPQSILCPRLRHHANTNKFFADRTRIELYPSIPEHAIAVDRNLIDAVKNAITSTSLLGQYQSKTEILTLNLA